MSDATDDPRAQVSRALGLLWYGYVPAGRGPKARLTLERIVDVAIEAADADGVDGLSMRRIARDLGVGTMSLYRYVPTKDVLLALVLDRVLAPVERAERGPGATWRDTLEADARDGRATFLRHPWLLQVNIVRTVIGPGNAAGLERTLAGLTDLPLSDRGKVNVIMALDGCVAGMVRQQIEYENLAEVTGLSDDEFWGAQLPFLEDAMESGGFPTLASLSMDAFEGSWEEAFDVGLAAFLDGLALRVHGRRAEG